MLCVDECLSVSGDVLRVPKTTIKIPPLNTHTQARTYAHTHIIMATGSTGSQPRSNILVRDSLTEIDDATMTQRLTRDDL